MIITVVLTLIISCVPLFDERPFVGFKLSITNLTGEELNNTKILKEVWKMEPLIVRSLLHCQH